MSEMVITQNVCSECWQIDCYDQHCRATLPFMNVESDSEVAQLCRSENENVYNSDNILVNLFDSNMHDVNEHDILEGNDPDKFFLYGIKCCFL